MLQKLKDASQEEFMSAVNNGLDVNTFFKIKGTSISYTPFMLVCLRGNEVLYELIRPKANIHLQDTFSRRTALMCAAFGKNKRIIKDLIESGVDVNAKDFNGDTPLHYLFHPQQIKKPEISLIDLFLKNGANINLTNDEGTSPLLNAVAYGDVSFIKYMKQKGADINLAQGDGLTPLIASIWSHNFKIFSFLLKSGANLEAREQAKLINDNIYYPGGTAVMTAVFNQHIKMLEKLVKAGAKLRTYGDCGETLLNIAVAHYKTKIIDKLISLGASPLENDSCDIDTFEVLDSMLYSNKNMKDKTEKSNYKKTIKCYKKVMKAPYKVISWNVQLPERQRYRED